MGATPRSRRRALACATLTALAVLGAGAGCELLVGDEARPLRPGAADDAGVEPDTALIVDAGDDARARVGATLELLAAGQGAPRAIALDDRSAYWANERDGVITVFDKASKDVRTFATPGDGGVAWKLRWVVLDAAQVFWNTDIGGACLPGILKQPKDGDAGFVSVAGCTDVLDRANGMGVDGTYVYWTTHIAASGLLAAPKEGGGIVTLAKDVGGQPDALAVTADAIYWINPTSENVTRWDKATQTTTVLSEGQKGLSAVASDGQYVYFANTVSVLRVPGNGSVDAGTPVEVVASSQNGPVSMAVFEDQVYWANAGDGTIMRAPKAGGAAALVAREQAGVRSIAVDASGVYFTRDTGEVARVTFGNDLHVP